MSTSRRTMLWLAGIAAFGAAFLLYNSFLGWIDGLPALPERYLQVSHGETQPEEASPPEPKIVRMLRQAYGENCREAKYPIKLSVQVQGLLLATVQVDFEEGRVRLAPFSLAMFGKTNLETGYPEINTIHCDVAYVTFDRPIRFWTDMSTAKLVSAEFLGVEAPLDPNRDPRGGKIWVVHNHCTPQADDDLVFATRGPVNYRDQTEQNSNIPQIWTDSVVDITDYQSKPAHKIDAVGMKVFLGPSAPRNGSDKKAAPASRAMSQQVRKMQLSSNVNMNLVLDGGLPGHPDKKSSSSAAGCTRLFVWNPGSFLYDFETDHASFDLPPPNPAKLAPDIIRVIRELPDKQTDQLLCERLQLQFRHKNAAIPSVAPNGSVKAKAEADDADGRGLEIVTMRALGRIALTADSENVRAFGNELDYNHDFEQTTVRGSPATVMRDASIIRCPEVRFIQRDGPAPPSNAVELVEIGRCLGPGQARLVDDKEGKQIDVTWRDLLLVQQEGALQRITVTGNATCDQRAEHQHMEGDLIRLWLKEDSVSPTATQAAFANSMAAAPSARKGNESSAGMNDQASSAERRKKPHKVLVVGHVSAYSPDMILRNAKQLTVWFQDVSLLPSGSQASAVPQPVPANNMSSSSTIVPLASLQSNEDALTASSSPTPFQPGPQELKIPLEVSAEIVESFIVRSGSSNELDRVYCKDHVEVHQEPKDPKDRALDIRCRELDLTHTPDGDRVRLRGTDSEWAMVQAQTMTLFGPKVMFDQKDNRAEIEDGGKMQLPASSSLNGEHLDKPSDIVVRWNGKMKFNGLSAEFHGGVIAEQDGVRVTCPTMNVYLDRQVSFKKLQQTSKASTAKSSGAPNTSCQDDDQPQVKKVVCHRGDENTRQPVIITERVVKDDKLVRYQMIVAPNVAFINDESKLQADGPGEVRTLQYGDKMGPDETGKDKSSKEPEQELQLTRILFQGRMEANNRTRETKFISGVRAVHTPAEQIDIRIDEDHLPAGAFTLRCEHLTASFRMEAERKIPTMEARKHAEIQSDEFSGRADEIFYDEGKNQQVTFMGTNSNLAEVIHRPIRGQEGRQYFGKTIMFWRKTNQVQVTDSAGGVIPN
ncbi:MAG TPA: hypothetical protein VKS79_03985 [Gemmataceae bacterium]|nr:hypothetical protein [Gemmataceae bacterium]